MNRWAVEYNLVNRIWRPQNSRQHGTELRKRVLESDQINLYRCAILNNPPNMTKYLFFH